MKVYIPKKVEPIATRVKKVGGKGYIIGGYVRDWINKYSLNRRDTKSPKDIDIFTDLQPKQLQKIFPNAKAIGTADRLNNKIYTVTYNGIEISTFRKDGKREKFGTTLKEHINTCDFKINSMAVNINTQRFTDFLDGYYDLNHRLLRWVGTPEERIEEDPHRLMRGIRFSAELGLSIPNTTSFSDNAHKIMTISLERIRDEFNAILLSGNPKLGIENLIYHNLLNYIQPEFLRTIGHYCGKTHKFTVDEHILHAVHYLRNKELAVILAAYFHDIGKPIMFDGFTFHNHEMESESIARAWMHKYRYPHKVIDDVCCLVRSHMISYFQADRKPITERAVRRLIRRVGKERIFLLLDLHDADRYAHYGKPNPAKLFRKAVQRELNKEMAFSTSDLKITGKELMAMGFVKEEIGTMMQLLFDRVVENPLLNTNEKLKKLVIANETRAKEIAKQLVKKKQEARKKSK